MTPHSQTAGCQIGSSPRLWPRWRNALVLVQPATVARWHREGFRGCCRRPSRRPGRPCIDSQLRSLIRRLATENRLWGAPRIHGELLKLGITVSERTVSRYLPDRLTAPSQTWRTFLANHLGELEFISQVTSSSAARDDDVADAACDLVFRPALLLSDAPCASNLWAVVDWPPALRRRSLGWRVAQDHLHDRARTHPTTGRDPPTAWAVASCFAPYGRRFRSSGADIWPLRPMNSLKTFRSPGAGSAVLSPSLCNRVVNVVGGPQTSSLRPRSARLRGDSHGGWSIGEAQASPIDVQVSSAFVDRRPPWG
jgi:hypothetical protein